MIYAEKTIGRPKGWVVAWRNQEVPWFASFRTKKLAVLFAGDVFPTLPFSSQYTLGVFQWHKDIQEAISSEHRPFATNIRYALERMFTGG